MPIGLAVSTVLVAVSGVSIGAQFSTIFLAALTIGLRTVETVPATIAVLTAHTLQAGLGWLGLAIDRSVIDIDELIVRVDLFEIGEIAPGRRRVDGRHLAGSGTPRTST